MKNLSPLSLIVLFGFWFVAFERAALAETAQRAAKPLTLETEVLPSGVALKIDGLSKPDYSYRELDNPRRVLLELPSQKLPSASILQIPTNELIDRIQVSPDGRLDQMMVFLTDRAHAKPRVRESRSGGNHSLTLTIRPQRGPQREPQGDRQTDRFGDARAMLARPSFSDAATNSAVPTRTVHARTWGGDVKTRVVGTELGAIASSVSQPPLPTSPSSPMPVAARRLPAKTVKEAPRSRKKSPQAGELPFSLSKDVLYLEKNREQVLTLTNRSQYNVSLQVVVNKLSGAGTKKEQRNRSDELEVYPRELTLPPRGTQDLLFLYGQDVLSSEVVFEVSFLEPGSIAATPETAPRPIGIGLLALVQPEKRTSRIRWERDEETLSFYNEGNISAFFHSGKFCKSSEDCLTIPAFRIYPGRSVGIPVVGDYPVTITQQLAVASKKYDIPGLSYTRRQ